MREASFLSKNEKKWRKVESILEKESKVSPDESANLFVSLTNDLSYARTHYPESITTRYLNSLTARIFQQINVGRREKFSRIYKFWKYELPMVVARHHKKMLWVFLYFVTCVAIGVISTHYDETFPRVVLGDRYVDMTLENIANGDPMGVYKHTSSNPMFLYITYNNIRVAGYIFIGGLLASLGTYYFLFTNGVMLGTFQYFFVQKGLFLSSFLTIWIHGTLEISSFIIAGTAGVVLGNSLLYPGSYPRKTSLVFGAKEALKILIGIIPLIIFSAFLESFITRLTNSPALVKGGIILASLCFVIWYFILYPRKLRTKQLVKS